MITEKSLKSWINTRQHVCSVYMRLFKYILSNINPISESKYEFSIQELSVSYIDEMELMSVLMKFISSDVHVFFDSSPHSLDDDGDEIIINDRQAIKDISDVLENIYVSINLQYVGFSPAMLNCASCTFIIDDVNIGYINEYISNIEFIDWDIEYSFV